MFAGINVVVVDLAVVVSLYLSVLEVVVWCEYAIVVVLMVVSGGGRVVLEVVYVPCDSESNENKLEPRILLIFLPDRI